MGQGDPFCSCLSVRNRPIEIVLGVPSQHYFGFSHFGVSSSVPPFFGGEARNHERDVREEVKTLLLREREREWPRASC